MTNTIGDLKMGFHGECGRGWSARCANSKGKKCRCKCGGANHGKLVQNQVTIDATREEVREVLDFAKRHANYSIVSDSPEALTIRDEGPWDQHPTVTNDADWVVSQLAPQLNGRRLFYFDTEQRLDQMLVESGRFAGFAPAS